MINLAYDTQCDQFIEKELTRCGIPIVATDERPHSDVPYTRIGQLGPFTFRRFWYYWSVKGIVPIQVARELIESLWEGLGHVPFDSASSFDPDERKGEDPDDLYLAEPYHIWKRGTPRIDVWKWFDEQSPHGIVQLLHGARLVA